MDHASIATTAPEDPESGAAVVEYLGLIIVVTMMTTTLMGVASERVRTEFADLFIDKLVAAVEEPAAEADPAENDATTPARQK